jgi:hypothetical protein
VVRFSGGRNSERGPGRLQARDTDGGPLLGIPPWDGWRWANNLTERRRPFYVGADGKRFLASLRAATVLRALAGVRRSRLKPPSIRVGLLPPTTCSSLRSWRLERAVVGRPCARSVRPAHPVSSRAPPPSPVSQPVDHLGGERRPAALSAAPAGRTPVSTHRHQAISRGRARATIPLRRRRLRPWPQRG